MIANVKCTIGTKESNLLRNPHCLALIRSTCSSCLQFEL